jgi:hypothetical protein
MGKLFGQVRDHDHKERVSRKHDAVELLKALRDTWLKAVQPDHPYIRHLDRRIHKLETQLRNMRP